MKNLIVVGSNGYRPDVDGLRAVAVLSVILFHIDSVLIPGGFVGVDIFFVISGFLISRNIIQDIEGDRFSLLDFYRRRIKRIVPPMLVVVLATVVVAQTIMLPLDAEWVADSALWSLASLSNVYFWLFQDVSYFAADSKELPLLHLWSLGVEEQFYLVWPFLLMLFYRASRVRPLVLVLIIAGACSFVLGEAVLGSAPKFAYYMLPARAGELLAGALVAIAVLRQTNHYIPGYLAVLMSWLGVALLVYSFSMLSEDEAFPGLNAIPPALGAASIILAAHYRKNLVSRLLSLKPIVWIGLVSYSAYLWHWPLLAFLRYGFGKVTPEAGTAIFVATFLLAWLSYIFVEQPARRTKASVIRVVLQQYILPAGALGVLCLATMYSDGYGLRNVFGNYRTALDTMRSQTRAAVKYDYICRVSRIRPEILKDRRCIVGAASESPPDVILWGDSNASHYVGMVGRFAQQAGFSFRNIAAGACPPIDDDPEPFVPRWNVDNCRFSLTTVRPFVDRFQVVIVSAQWTMYRNGEDFLRSFLKTARRLAKEGKLVIILGKVPVMSGFDLRCREKSLSFPGLKCVNLGKPIGPEIASFNGALRDFARQTENVEYFDGNKFLCPNGICSPLDSDGMSMFHDEDHLAMNASWKLGKWILERDGLPEPFRRIEAFPQRRAPD